MIQDLWQMPSLLGPYIVIIAFVFLFGLCLGSFANVLIYRIPKGLSFARGRSVCPHCDRQLSAIDLIPVISFIALRGKCRTCKAPISIRYPLVEFMGGVIAVVSFLAFDFLENTFIWIFAFLVGIIFLVITMIDFDTMTIPDGLIISLIPFAFASMFLFPEVDLKARVIGFFCISLPMLGVAMLFDGSASKDDINEHDSSSEDDIDAQGSFGGGDIKLIAVCGFMLGWKETLLAMFIAVMTSGVYAVYLLASGKAKRDSHLAFGPYICLGSFIALLYGTELIALYLGGFYG